MRSSIPLALALLLAACHGDVGGPTSSEPFCASGTDVAGLHVPDGFCIRKYADVKTPRVLAFAPNGDLFVSSPTTETAGGAPAGIGGIYVLRDDGHGAATVTVYQQSADLADVHGLAFIPNKLLYTTGPAVWALAYSSGDRSGVGKARTQFADLSDMHDLDRFTHTLAVAQDGTVLVSRGQYDTDSCPPLYPRSGSVLRIGPGHSAQGDIVMSNLRNPMFLRCETWGCFAAELSGDSWEQYGGTEKLIPVKDGADYGYPCCVDHDVPRPDVAGRYDCSRHPSSLQTYRLHDTPFGFDWAPADKWPAPYGTALYVGMHGSSYEPWAGTRLGWAPIDPQSHLPTGDLMDFVTGFGKAGPVVGRVADVLFAPDGRLFFTDDEGGAVYWVAPKTLKPAS